MKISFTKANNQRFVMLPKKLKSDLDKYIELKKPEKYLFFARKDKYTIKPAQNIFLSAAMKVKNKKRQVDLLCDTPLELTCWRKE